MLDVADVEVRPFGPVVRLMEPAIDVDDIEASAESPEIDVVDVYREPVVTKIDVDRGLKPLHAFNTDVSVFR